MKNYDRMLRVNEMVKRELGEQIEKSVATEVDGVVTVTKVVTAPDLRHAQVYVSYMGPEEHRSTVMKLLSKHRPHLQSSLAERIKLKYTPVLHFRIDTGAEAADRVLNLIDQLDIPDVNAAEPDQEIDDQA